MSRPAALQIPRPPLPLALPAPSREQDCSTGTILFPEAHKPAHSQMETVPATAFFCLHSLRQSPILLALFHRTFHACPSPSSRCRTLPPPPSPVHEPVFQLVFQPVSHGTGSGAGPGTGDGTGCGTMVSPLEPAPDASWAEAPGRVLDGGSAAAQPGSAPVLNAPLDAGFQHIHPQGPGAPVPAKGVRAPSGGTPPLDAAGAGHSPPALSWPLPDGRSRDQPQGPPHFVRRHVAGRDSGLGLVAASCRKPRQRRSQPGQFRRGSTALRACLGAASLCLGSPIAHSWECGAGLVPVFPVVQRAPHRHRVRRGVRRCLVRSWGTGPASRGLAASPHGLFFPHHFGGPHAD